MFKFITLVLFVSTHAYSKDSAEVEAEFKKIVTSQFIPAPILDSLVYRTYIIEKMSKDDFNNKEKKK